uniref:ADNP homeobox 2b n=1 Tax=Hucho hucho TaxID=62062 RepID=A0A4W5MPN2_9TELE
MRHSVKTSFSRTEIPQGFACHIRSVLLTDKWLTVLENSECFISNGTKYVHILFSGPEWEAFYFGHARLSKTVKSCNDPLEVNCMLLSATIFQELQKKNSDEDSDSDEAFQETEWVDLSEPFQGKRKKKWPYRTRLLCCSLCKYSTRNWYSYKSHLQRSHEYERKLCVLAPCQICSFVAHPRLLKKHLLLFHGSPNVDQDAASQHSTTKKGDRFKCRKCRYVDSNLFSMKKHVLLNHLEKLWHHFSGRIPDTKFPHTASRQFCKVCKMAIESTEHMLHHILASPTHQWACAQIRTWILENTQYAKLANYQILAPKKQLPQVSSPEQLAGPNQSFLPPQALVQQAGAEAKGLVQPGATVKLQSALPQGAISATMPIGQNMVRLPSGASLPGAPHNQVPFTIGVQGQQQPQQVFLPPRVQISIPGMSQALMVTQRLPLNQGTPQGTMLQSNPQGTMLTSQSLLSHLFPTGNKVNGMPTYTFATPVAGNPSLNSKAKKWITCPICNELLPSNVYEAHQQAAHKAQPRTAKQQGLAARAPFLRKMPNKTVKCLKCKILLSEKGLFEHLLHGLNCLYCPGMFYSIQQLVEHTNTQHNPTQKANCDFMRREYRLYTDDSGNLLFPYFDINTMAPKEILGDAELKLALVTNSLDLIFLKMQPGGKQEVCRNPSKTTRTDCPFCEEKCVTVENYQAHLSGKHCIAPTVHAILKTAAFKCIYCNGVYTGKTTQRAIVIHLQRCRRAPKTPKDADRLQPAPTNGRQQQVMAFKQMVQVPGLYSAQLPPVPMKERDARAAFRKQREKEKREQVPKMDPYIQLALDPSGMEKRPSEERKDFLTRYFHTKPYPTKKESEELSKRLWLTRTEVSTLFGMKRTKCMKAIQKNSPTIFMGFNMTELKKLKHDLFIPEVEPVEPEKMADQEVEPDEPEQTDSPEGETAEPEMSVPKEDSLEPHQMDVPEMDPLEPQPMAV